MSESVERARTLRRNMTDAEQSFWRRVRDRRFGGLKFRRQAPIGSYIADFLCFERKLIVELDGGQHVEKSAYDENRTHFLEKQGYQVIRFWDNDVLKNMDGVLLELACVCGLNDPHPSPLPDGRGRSLD
jgi:adenine-specific DNA-methyltransferase